MRVARARGRNLLISTKQSVEVCRAIKGMRAEHAILFLKEVIEQKRAIPFKRYRRDVSHRPGIGAGRYPKKACEFIIKVLQNAIANAQQLGMDKSKLVVNKAIANLAISVERRKRGGIGRKVGLGRQTHVEIELMER
jgi:large subunit ribosomal protein L22